MTGALAAFDLALVIGLVALWWVIEDDPFARGMLATLVVWAFAAVQGALCVIGYRVTRRRRWRIAFLIHGLLGLALFPVFDLGLLL